MNSLVAEIYPDENDQWWIQVWHEDDPEKVLREHGPYHTMDEAISAAMEKEPTARVW